MNILYVVHQFLPPKHVAGTEIYTANLAREMATAGHGVTLFFTESSLEQPQYTLNQGEFSGLTYFEAIHNYEYADFAATWRDGKMEDIFRQVLNAVKPDLVHVQHLHLHSIGYLEIIKELQIPLVYTLHEFMLMCPRGGQLLLPDYRLCPGPEPTDCARCVQHLPAPTPTTDGSDPYSAAVALRQRTILEKLPLVDLFISPSAFLREQFIAAGYINPDRIIHSDNGFATANYEKREHTSADKLRVGYIGTLAEYKGVHLLIDAFGEIPVDQAECHIYGDPNIFPDYGRRLSEMEKPENVHLQGYFDNQQVGKILAGIDLLVIPSLWYENSPLTIHEAYLAGIPVIAADQGGMAELVDDGKSGLLFRLGDARDLHDKIKRCLTEPGLMEALRQGIPAVKSIGEDAVLMQQRYETLRHQ